MCTEVYIYIVIYTCIHKYTGYYDLAIQVWFFWSFQKMITRCLPWLPYVRTHLEPQWHDDLGPWEFPTLVRFFVLAVKTHWFPCSHQHSWFFHRCWPNPNCRRLKTQFLPRLERSSNNPILCPFLGRLMKQARHLSECHEALSLVIFHSLLLNITSSNRKIIYKLAMFSDVHPFSTATNHQWVNQDISVGPPKIAPELLCHQTWEIFGVGV